MARGWESKAVEDQLEEMARAKQEAAAVPQSPEIIELKKKRETFQLTRSKLQEQLQNSRSEAHQQMLKRSLQAIEAELESL